MYPTHMTRKVFLLMALSVSPAAAQAWEYAVLEDCATCKNGSKWESSTGQKTTSNLGEIQTYFEALLPKYTPPDASAYLTLLGMIGQMGWELVAVNEYLSWDRQPGTRYVFKRPQPK